ncbi:uncharacterized protein B0J16DRAFT_382405 [Fusarium flagelliforme]|uniref:uncharacterized protein n=1 Tax=Fusarium flagelliforme TaxID=2675880 RepID=UPI001E8C9D43|nr:uncharacterized protein B0J16DRAFT_382405 [Fusarium flagelliforme]KAH7188526.1 hypothetical protein B0J16DRAFT_382405 [Fusarium flagelliforme]
MPSQPKPSAVAAMVTGAAVVLVPAIVASPVLGILGLGGAGVAAGSAAAGIQSGIGSVAAGSLFATLQSAGAGGYGVAAVHGVVQAAGAVDMVLAKAKTLLKIDDEDSTGEQGSGDYNTTNENAPKAYCPFS